jgi:hypothetical protein
MSNDIIKIFGECFGSNGFSFFGHTFRKNSCFVCILIPVFGMGDVRQRNLRETTPNMSFGPKVVDWACSLRKTKKWFRWQKLMLCMHPHTRFWNGQRAATKLRETTQT